LYAVASCFKAKSALLSFGIVISSDRLRRPERESRHQAGDASPIPPIDLAVEGHREDPTARRDPHEARLSWEKLCALAFASLQ
jgi:hypothetical protein